MRRALLAIILLAYGKLDMPKKILFVDDEAKWREMVSEFLTCAGYEVRTAENGTEAMLAADQVRPDLMVLDLNLSGESGFNLMAFLVENHPGIPIIVHSGLSNDDEAIQFMLANGAYRYVQKSSLEALLKAVQEAPSALASRTAEPA